jgi:hypothetical protein
MTVAKNRADRVMLYDISWQQFENLLKDLGEHRAAKLAYVDNFKNQIRFLYINR